MRDRRGGILLRLLLTAALAAGGVFLWRAWNRGRLALPRVVPSAARVPPPPSLGEKSVWVQKEVRDLLARHGLKEPHVLKTYTREHREGGVQWLEDTLELRLPAGFDAARFRRELGETLKKEGVTVVSEYKQEGKWALELGFGRRVLERIHFYEQRTP